MPLQLDYQPASERESSFRQIGLWLTVAHCLGVVVLCCASVSPDAGWEGAGDWRRGTTLEKWVLLSQTSIGRWIGVPLADLILIRAFVARSRRLLWTGGACHVLVALVLLGSTALAVSLSPLPLRVLPINPPLLTTRAYGYDALHSAVILALLYNGLPLILAWLGLRRLDSAAA